MLRKLQIIIEKDMKDKLYNITVPALPGCVSQGKTKKEALLRIKESIEVTLEGFSAIGKKPDFKKIDVTLEDIKVAA